jgi:hypothetical protein
MMTLRTLLTLACGSAVALAAAGAQDSLNLRGVVKSVAGNPIAGVEVRIDGSRFVTRSDQGGRFAFVNAPKGPQLLRFRLVGYLPATAEVKVPTTAEPIEVQMIPMPPSLDTVHVVASVNVLAGVVVDHKDRPIPGATVDMLNGASATTTTDSSGWFSFASVKSGTVLVRARKLGFAATTTSIRLEDWRGLVIHLDPLDFNLSGSKLEAASGFGNGNTFVWTETQQRLSMRGLRAIVVPREELAPYDDYPLGQAIQRTPTGSAEASDLSAAGTNVCVLLNGKNTVGPSSLDSYRTEDVEFVELYPPGTEMSGSVSRYLRNSGCRRVQVPGSFAVGPYYVVIWLRS